MCKSSRSWVASHSPKRALLIRDTRSYKRQMLTTTVGSLRGRSSLHGIYVQASNITYVVTRHTLSPFPHPLFPRRPFPSPSSLSCRPASLDAWAVSCLIDACTVGGRLIVSHPTLAPIGEDKPTAPRLRSDARCHEVRESGNQYPATIAITHKISQPEPSG